MSTLRVPDETNLRERIVAARRQAKVLKEELRKSKTEAHDTTLSTMAEELESLPLIVMKARRTLRGHLSKIYSMHWSKNPRHLVSASQDGKLIIWEAYTGYKMHCIPLNSPWVMTCAYSPSGNCVAAGGLDNACTVYNFGSDGGVPKTELHGHLGYLSCSRFLNDREIITSSGDMMCALWDIETKRKVTEFAGHTADVLSLSLSPTNHTFVSGGCDTAARVWDIRTGRQTLIFDDDGVTDINAISFFPNGNAFGTGSDDSTCRLFDIRAASQLNEYKKDDILSAVTSVSFSHSGRLLFGGYEDWRCNIWDALKNEHVGVLNHENRISSLGVSPDGTALCTASWDSTLKVS
ncbi:hypothetical protein M422DRAFT_154579 [Sphaerobolus stellatus SS14]|nr:hypothetical protein M422DRAFT_154579 [Sphaerobolus stellatus SS14]